MELCSEDALKMLKALTALLLDSLEHGTFPVEEYLTIVEILLALEYLING